MWYQGDGINVGEVTLKSARCSFVALARTMLTMVGSIGTTKYANGCCSSYQRGICKPQIASEGLDTTNTEILGRTLAMDS